MCNRGKAGVSQRCAFAIALLHWMQRELDDLHDFDLSQGGIYEVILSEDEAPHVRAVE